MNKNFNGIYTSYIKELINLKHSLGFKYESGEYILFVFDKFTIKRSETKVGITKELSDAWCARRDNESSSYHYKRCFMMCSLSSFLCKKGIHSYLPQMPRLETTFTPYIFSKEEVNAIFSACDNLKSGNNDMRSSVFIMPALCRTLYGTGIRIGEALSLVNKDVNLKDNYFILRDTKNGKDRMVPFSTSLSEILKEYKSYRAKLPVYISEETPFFVTLQGTICNRDSIYRRFCKVLALANIPKGQIRLHDIRHSMACHALAQMVEEGMDLYTSLPILSTYLGHQSIRATNTYVRLTADMYPDIIRKIELISFNIFPKL